MSDETDCIYDPASRLTEPERKSQFYLQLADRARARYEAIRATEWKTNFLVWTVYVAGIASVINLDRGACPPWLAWVIGIAGVFLAMLYAFVWLPYIHEAHERNGQVSYWWECAARIAAGEDKEDTLPPDLTAPDRWRRPNGWGSSKDIWPEWHVLKQNSL